jgi:hypothetical protein
MKKIISTTFLIICFTSIFSQEIDTVNFHADSWKLDRTNEIVFFPIDTTLNEFQFYNPFFMQSFHNFYLGRVLTPSKPSVFINQEKNFNENLFISSYINNIIEPEDVKYYKTLKPYTDIFYTTSRKIIEEQLLTLVHTQNVNSRLNIGLKYNLLTAKDSTVDNGENSSSNSLAIWSDYSGYRYSFHTNLTYNKLKIIESGGIVDSVEEFNYNPTTTFLSATGSQISDNYFFIVQEYKLGKTDVEVVNDSTFVENFTEKSVLSHTLKFERSYHKFSEKEVNTDFFENIFIDSIKTSDSTYFGKLTNSVQLKSKKYELLGMELNVLLALSTDLYKYYNFKNYFSTNRPVYKSSSYLIAGINNFKIKSFTADFYVKYCLIGYNLADLEFNSNLKKQFTLKQDTLSLIIKFDYQHKEPVYFIQNYYSNHNFWSNDFSKQKNISLSLQIIKPKQFIDLTLNSTILNDYIYFNFNSQPAQLKGIISVNSVYLRKDIKFWKFYMINKLVYQNITNNDILSLPDFLVLNSTFINALIFKKVLNVQLGFDVFFSTGYNAYSYNPSISAFYQSSENKSGNYPIINPFLKMKLKTALIFFQVEHIGLNSIQDYYYHVNHYHIPKYFFRFGVKWWFSN